jgi:hypothetical protein
MSRLNWDATGERKYEIGVSKGVLYRATESDPYGLGVAWNGLTNVTESPEGAEPTDLYADGIKYATLRSPETHKITIEAFTYPDEFAECDGSVEPVPGLRLNQQKRKPFGFSYRTEVGDDVNEAGDADGDYKLHLVYGCTASPAERSYATINDSPDAEAISWEVNTSPVAVPGYKPSACLTIESSKVPAAKLAALEEILYGKDGAQSVEPRLPLPEEVITLMSGT